MVVFQKARFKKNDRFYKIRRFYPSLTIVNNNPLLTIVNDDPSSTIVKDNPSLMTVNGDPFVNDR